MNPEEAINISREQQFGAAALPVLDSEASIKLIHRLSAAETKTLHAQAMRHADALMSKYSPSFTSQPQVQARLEQWCISPEGRAVLGAVIDTLLDTLATRANPGPPSHDFRHMGIKDPTSALKICCDTEFSAVEETFLISTLAHDIGRLVEHHLTEESLRDLPSRVHGELSFLYLQSILNDYPELPPELRDDLLYAVLKHSELNPLQNTILEAVQQADRAHMLGPEGIARFLAYDVGLCDLPLIAKTRDEQGILFGSQAEESFTSTLAFFINNLVPPTITPGGAHFNAVRSSTATFLLLLHAYEDQEAVMNHPLFSNSNQNHLESLDWEAIRRRANSYPQSNENLRDILKNTMSPLHSPDVEETYCYGPAGCTTDTTVFEKVLRQAEALSPQLQQRFINALTFQIEERKHFDKIDCLTLEKAKQRFQKTGTLAERVTLFVARAVTGRCHL